MEVEGTNHIMAQVPTCSPKASIAVSAAVHQYIYEQAHESHVGRIDLANVEEGGGT